MMQTMFQEQPPVWWPSTWEFSSRVIDSGRHACESIRVAMREHFQVAWELLCHWQPSDARVASDAYMLEVQLGQCQGLLKFEIEVADIIDLKPTSNVGQQIYLQALIVLGRMAGSCSLCVSEPYCDSGKSCSILSKLTMHDQQENSTLQRSPPQSLGLFGQCWTYGINHCSHAIPLW